MSRETKYNLIFLTLFLGISLPGGVRLFLKKLYEEKPRPITMRTPAKEAAAYMDPAPHPSDTPREAPEQVGRWLSTLVAQRLEPQRGTAEVIRLITGRISRPGRRFEPLALARRADAPAELWVLVWHLPQPSPQRLSNTPSKDAKASPSSKAPSFDIRWNGRAVEQAELQRIPLPKAPRQALQEMGYVKPPERVGLLRLTAPASLAPKEASQGRMHLQMLGERPLSIPVAPSGSDPRERGS